MKTLKALSCFCLLVSCGLTTAQDPGQLPQASEEHGLLEKFVGEWTSVSESTAMEGQPAMRAEGKMTSRMLGGFWVVNEMEAEMMGVTIHAVQKLGYEPDTKKYVGTWVDSMLPHCWQYSGTLEGNTLNLEAEGPDIIGGTGGTRLFRDAYEFKSADEIVLTSSVKGDDGKWITFMTGTMKRTK